jgi:hypothetical protein
LHKFAEDEWLQFLKAYFLAIDFSRQIDSLNINKSNYTCNDVVSNDFMHCMENYYSKKIGCVLPWVLFQGRNNHGMNVCRGKEKYWEFKNISMNILMPEENKELNKEGCFIPNCQQRSWSIRFKETFETKAVNWVVTNEREKNTSGFIYDMSQETKTLVRKEVRLYTAINFFAEVGGYLGLLLGESLISYLIISSKWIQIIYKKLKGKCTKIDKDEDMK